MQHHNHIPKPNHYIVMFFIMLLAGVLSTMNVWADKPADVRLSLNDLYMILLMTGWMFLFMGAFYREWNVFFVGLGLVLTQVWCIRTQFMVSTDQYLQGMIPHHSMAVHMSRQLLRKPNHIPDFLQHIIRSQEGEIELMRQRQQVKA